jgi:hypothetical protein
MNGKVIEEQKLNSESYKAVTFIQDLRKELDHLPMSNKKFSLNDAVINIYFLT